MKLRVDLIWSGGLLADREPDTHPEPEYERWVAPSPSAKDAAMISRLLEILESNPGAEAFDRRLARNTLVGQLYQYGHPPETAARIRAQLDAAG